MLKKVTPFIDTTVFALNDRSVAFQGQGMIKKQFKNRIWLFLVTWVFARFSCTAVRAKALQIGKHEKKDPPMFPAPYAISSWNEKREEKQQYDYMDLWFVKQEP